MLGRNIKKNYHTDERFFFTYHTVQEATTRLRQIN